MSTAFGALRRISLSLRASGLTIFIPPSLISPQLNSVKGTAHPPYAPGTSSYLKRQSLGPALLKLAHAVHAWPLEARVALSRT
jgi:hypothetical protein